MVGMKIDYDNQVIEFNVQYGNGKKISIHIDSSGRITLKVPKKTSEETIKSVVERNGKMIVEKLQSLEAARETPKMIRAYEDEGKFLYLGKYYSLHELIETAELSEEQLQLKLKKFYFSSCKKLIGERITRYQTQLRVKPKSIEIVESRTKWGSCSSDKKLTFNYRLAMAPWVIDYVIIHELCHLLHMNHDRSFWRRVGSLMPDYKEKEEYLARYGRAMTL